MSKMFNSRRRKHWKPLRGRQYKIGVLRRSRVQLSPTSLQSLSLGEIIYLCKICFSPINTHVTCTVTSFSCTIISCKWRVMLSLGSDTCTEGLLRNSKLSKTYVQGYLDVPCYREVVLNDEGYQMDLVEVDFETNWDKNWGQ